MTTTKRLSVNLPVELHQRLKLYCVQKGLPISFLVKVILMEKLDIYEIEDERARI